MPICLVIFGLVAGEFIGRLRVREAHRAGELFRLEHAEADIVLPALDDGLHELDAALGADGRAGSSTEWTRGARPLRSPKAAMMHANSPTGRARGLKAHGSKTRP